MRLSNLGDPLPYQFHCMSSNTVGVAESRELLVLYGSQTGTAQDVAERVARDGKRRHFRVRVMAMDSYNTVSMRSCVLKGPLVMSCTCVLVCLAV